MLDILKANCMGVYFKYMGFALGEMMDLEAMGVLAQVKRKKCSPTVVC